MAGEESQLRRRVGFEQRGIEEGRIRETTSTFTDEVARYLELRQDTDPQEAARYLELHPDADRQEVARFLELRHDADRQEIEKTAFFTRMREVFANIDLEDSRMPTPQQFMEFRGALNALFSRETQERLKREAREDRELAEYISTSPTPAPDEIEAVRSHYSVEYGELPRDIRTSEIAQNLNLLKDLLKEWWTNMQSGPSIRRAVEALPSSRATLGAILATKEYLERIQRTFEEEARFRELQAEVKAQVQETGEEVLLEPAISFERELPPGRFGRFREYLKEFWRFEPGEIKKAKNEFLATKPEIAWGLRDAFGEYTYRVKERLSPFRYTLRFAENQFAERTKNYRERVGLEQHREASEGEAEYTIFSQILEDVYNEVLLATAIAPEAKAFLDFRGALNKLFTPKEQAGFMRDAQDALKREQAEPPPRYPDELEEWEKNRIEPSPRMLTESPEARALRLEVVRKHYQDRYKEVPQDWALQDTFNDEKKLVVLSKRIKEDLEATLQDGQWTEGDFREYIKSQEGLRARIGLIILLQEAIRRREWRFADERYYEALKKSAKDKGRKARERLGSTTSTQLQTALKGLMKGEPATFFGGLGKIIVEGSRYLIGAAMRNTRRLKSLRRRKLSRPEEVK